MTIKLHIFLFTLCSHRNKRMKAGQGQAANCIFKGQMLHFSVRPQFEGNLNSSSIFWHWLFSNKKHFELFLSCCWLGHGWKEMSYNFPFFIYVDWRLISKKKQQNLKFWQFQLVRLSDCYCYIVITSEGIMSVFNIYILIRYIYCTSYDSHILKNWPHVFKLFLIKIFYSLDDSTVSFPDLCLNVVHAKFWVPVSDDSDTVLGP